MVRYEEWIERAKSSLELAQAKIIKYLQYEISKKPIQELLKDLVEVEELKEYISGRHNLKS